MSKEGKWEWQEAIDHHRHLGAASRGLRKIVLGAVSPVSVSVFLQIIDKQHTLTLSPQAANTVPAVISRSICQT